VMLCENQYERKTAFFFFSLNTHIYWTSSWPDCINKRS
jgi:hypothetical protein